MLTVHDINMMSNVIYPCATKEQIKKALNLTKDLNDTFEYLFPKSKWHPSGSYTKDNKRLYVFLEEGEFYLHGSIGRIQEVYSDLKESLLNRFANVTIQYVLNNPSEEVSKQLKQYFNDSNIQ